MLRFLGCICILAASSGMEYSCVLGLRQELHQTELLMEFLTALEGEITYHRCPLPEMLGQLSQHMPQPYCRLLLEGSRKMEDNSESDIPLLWKDVCEQFRPQLHIPSGAYQILLRMGEVFAYSSLEASLQLLALGRKKLASFIESQSVEFAGRRRLYCCLSYMAGLFSIILLL